MSVPELLTVTQVAERYGISVRRVQALAAARSIGTRYGERLLLFTPAEVERLRPGPPGRPPKATTP